MFAYFKLNIIITLAITIILILTVNFTINNWKNIKLLLPKSKEYIRKQTGEFLCEKKVAQILIRTQSKLVLIKKSASFGNVNYPQFKKSLLLGLRKELAVFLKLKGLRANDVIKTKQEIDVYKNSITNSCPNIYKNKNLESLIKLFFNVIEAK